MLVKKNKTIKNNPHAFVVLAKKPAWNVDRIKIEKWNSPTSAPYRLNKSHLYKDLTFTSIHFIFHSFVLPNPNPNHNMPNPNLPLAPIHTLPQNLALHPRTE